MSPKQFNNSENFNITEKQRVRISRGKKKKKKEKNDRNTEKQNRFKLQLDLPTKGNGFRSFENQKEISSKLRTLTRSDFEEQINGWLREPEIREREKINIR